MTRPRGILFDYGQTLVVEAGYDPHAGAAALLAHAAYVAPGATLDAVTERARRVTSELSAKRDQFGIETPWPSVTRLIHDYFGTRFDVPLAELEVVFWDASVTTHPMPGARDALQAFARAGIALGVVSNASFTGAVIHHELAKHGLTDHLAFVASSADYLVRKPGPLLYEVVAARLGLEPREIWFVGDRLETDIAGARAAGMYAVWLQPAGADPSDLPDATVRDWRELRRLVDEAT